MVVQIRGTSHLSTVKKRKVSLSQIHFRLIEEVNHKLKVDISFEEMGVNDKSSHEGIDSHLHTNL